MFNTDKESMFEMYQTSLNKVNYTRVLVSFQLLDLDLKLSEVEELIYYWKLAVKSMLTPNDAALEVNKGNIFVILNSSNQKQFDKKISEFMMETKNSNKGVISSLAYLSNEESEFLIKISN